MAFPGVVNTANTTGASTASLALTMPASIVAGNLLLAVSSSNATDAATTAMSGWTKLAATDKGAGFATLAAFAKVAAGSDTGTVTGSLANRAVITYQIDSWSGVISGIQVSIVDVATMDPPSVSVPAADDYLWLACVRNSAIITGAPTNYTNLLTAVASGNNVGSARRTLNATSDNPGVFTGSAINPVPGLIAIPPLATPFNVSNVYRRPLGPNYRR